MPPLQVSKTDTLAGLALRYNVSVSAVSHLMRSATHTTHDTRTCTRTQTRTRANMHAHLPQVAAIKRTNGLLADTSLFARDAIYIPASKQRWPEAASRPDSLSSSAAQPPHAHTLTSR